MSLRSYLFIAVILILNQSCDTHKKSQKVSITSVEEQEFNQWKLDRVAALTSPSGWLTITALIWLKEDKLSVGTADRYDVTIPYHASANFGTLHKRAENWYLTPAENSQITLDGKPIHEERLLNHDQSGKTNIVGYESLSWYIIKRENTYDKLHNYRLMFLTRIMKL